MRTAADTLKTLAQTAGLALTGDGAPTAGIDRGSFESLIVDVQMAIVTGVGAARLQHSDAIGSGYEDVPDAAAGGTTGVNRCQVRAVALKRYVRLVPTGVGGATFTCRLDGFEPTRPEDQGAGQYQPLVLGV